ARGGRRAGRRIAGRYIAGVAARVAFDDSAGFVQCRPRGAGTHAGQRNRSAPVVRRPLEECRRSQPEENRVANLGATEVRSLEQWAIGDRRRVGERQWADGRLPGADDLKSCAFRSKVWPKNSATPLSSKLSRWKSTTRNCFFCSARRVAARPRC